MVVRGVMAIVLGPAPVLSRDRAPSALLNFMGVYWLLAEVVSLHWGWTAERPRRRLPLAAGAIGVVTGGDSQRRDRTYRHRPPPGRV
jgi:hypothetical protein